MSHFTKIQTRIKDKAILVASLKAMGYYIQENVFIQGYKGRRQKVDLAAKKKDSYSIGFTLTPEGAYEIVADWWGVEGPREEAFQAALKQKLHEVRQRIKRQYALKKVLAAAKAQGFNVVSQERDNDGALHLTVRRWS